jgi:uncharacterized protein YkwD
MIARRIAGVVVAMALCAPAGAGTMSEIEQQALALINGYRAEAGCPPLEPQAQLIDAAQGHARAMATKDFFSHSSKNGTKFGSRIRASGFKGRKLAENIAAGQSSASEVVATWMNSKGHQKNILTCSLTHTGIGMAYQPDDEVLPGQSHPLRYYWVQDFGKQ